MHVHRGPTGPSVQHRLFSSQSPLLPASLLRSKSRQSCIQPPRFVSDAGTSNVWATRRPIPCVAAATTAGAPVQLPIDPAGDESHALGIFAAFNRCRTLFMILAGFAAWAYISSGLPSPGAFGSLSMAMPVSSGNGAELAAKSAWTGFATGVFHTLCGPDHLAGLAPLSIGRGRLAACALGALWGFGHSTGQMILGLIFALLKDKFHDLMPALDKWSAYIVPLTLITIGLVGIYESCFSKHEEHAAAEESNLEPSLAMAGAQSAAPAQKSGKRAGFTTYLTGIVHGLQPDALYVIIPALALPTKLAAICFITMFVVGTCAAMGGYTLLIGTTSKALIKDQPWLQAHLSTVACGFAILCGVLMLLAGQGVPVPLFS